MGPRLCVGRFSDDGEDCEAGGESVTLGERERERTFIDSQLLGLCFGTGDAVYDVPCSAQGQSDGETYETRSSGGNVCV